MKIEFFHSPKAYFSSKADYITHENASDFVCVLVYAKMFNFYRNKIDERFDKDNWFNIYKYGALKPFELHSRHLPYSYDVSSGIFAIVKKQNNLKYVLHGMNYAFFGLDEILNQAKEHVTYLKLEPYRHCRRYGVLLQ